MESIDHRDDSFSSFSQLAALAKDPRSALSRSRVPGFPLSFVL